MDNELSAGLVCERIVAQRSVNDRLRRNATCRMPLLSTTSIDRLSPFASGRITSSHVGRLSQQQRQQQRWEKSISNRIYKDRIASPDRTDDFRRTIDGCGLSANIDTTARLPSQFGFRVRFHFRTITHIFPVTSKITRHTRSKKPIALYRINIALVSSRPFRCHAVTRGMSFTHMCLCSPSSINWYRPRAVTL